MEEDTIKNLYKLLEKRENEVELVDESDKLVYVNRKVVNLTKYTKDEFFGKNPNILKSGKHSKEFYEKLWNRVLEGESWEGFFINKKKDGRLFYEKAIIVPFLDEKGKVREFLKIGNQIKKEEYSEKKLKWIVEKIDDVFVDISNAMILVCGDKISSFNVLAKKLSENNNGNLKIEDIFDWKSSLEFENSIYKNLDFNEFKNILLKCIKDNIDFVTKLKDGTWVEVTSYKINCKDVNLLILKNIDARRKKEEKNLSYRIGLENEIEVRDKFVRTITHEIRSPLSVILGYSENIMKENRDIKGVKEIYQTSKYLLELVNNILDFSKFSSGKIILEKIDFDIYELVSSVKSMVLAEITRKKLKLKLVVDNDVPRLLNGAEYRIRQILLNLISNSIKFTKEGFVDVEIYYKENKLIIVEKDSGVGIPKGKQKAIFDPFVQADESVERKYGGTGLGLSIVKEIVMAMGGTIVLESERNKGCKFTLKIPIEKSEKSENILEIENWIENMGGDYESRELMMSAIESLEKRDKKLKEAIKNKKIEKIKFITHKLKGVSGNFGFIKLEKISKEINDEVKKEKFDFEKIDKLFLELNKNIEEISNYYEEGIEERNNLNGKVLVIEDDIFNNRLLKKVIEEKGLDVETAFNGKEGLNKILNEDYDLIFLDEKMPILDGIGLLNIIKERELKKDTYIILLTGNYFGGKEIENLKEKGVDEIIQKPLEIEALNYKLKTFFYVPNNIKNRLKELVKDLSREEFMTKEEFEEKLGFSDLNNLIFRKLISNWKENESYLKTEVVLNNLLDFFLQNKDK
ncbi:hybrid sensor histidine kinase/response regulator [Haliovirga abyssi]|uniref:histidine kinase n=1 Tax=Haliovirga abyssi TaxID=2996794 RepID=A0AAU9D0R8_9FUSO|nr:ATP-binding protein [Haliovirga abyssi]BDU49556.1 hypothetical protein HLVA_01250 [Haliovirga abyssi]